jgi:hypothetical protein
MKNTKTYLMAHTDTINRYHVNKVKWQMELTKLERNRIDP